MLLLVSILKAISEILIFSLIGQSILGLIAGRARDSNFVYKLLVAVTRPLMRLARLLSPRLVLDRHIWMVAVLLVLVVWVIAGAQKLELCVTEAAESPLCGQMVQTLKDRRDDKP